MCGFSNIVAFALLIEHHLLFFFSVTLKNGDGKNSKSSSNSSSKGVGGTVTNETNDEFSTNFYR